MEEDLKLMKNFKAGDRGSFATIYVYKEKYKGKYAFKTYLFTIIRNKSIDYIRKKHTIPLDEIVEPMSRDYTEDIILKEEQKRLVKEKINLIMILMLLMIVSVMALAKFQGSNFDFWEITFGTWISAAFLGMIGFTVANLTCLL